MARRRRTSAFEDMIELASRLPWWLSLILALTSYFLLHAYATSPIPRATDPHQIASQMTSSMFRGLAVGGQYFLPLGFICGAIGSVVTRRHRRKLFANTAAAIKPGQAIDGISWLEFEQLIGEAFRRKGYSVSEQGGAGPDGGIDLILHKDGEKYFVQCKHWRSIKVGVSVIREFFGLVVAHGAVGGFVVTSGAFTKDAKEFSLGRGIVLIDGQGLGKIISETPPSVRSVESENKRICPACDSELVLKLARKGARAGQKFWGCSSYPRCLFTLNIGGA